MAKIECTEELVEHFTAIVKAALVAYPEDSARLHKAALIVLDGGVNIDHDGIAWVTSTGGTRSYRVNGHCPCPDAQYNAPDGRCKHRWSKTLYNRVMAKQNDDAEAMIQHHLDGYASLTEKVCDTDRAQRRSGCYGVVAGK